MTLEDVIQFQFTHPGRGATLARRDRQGQGAHVSIHAPREGCDFGVVMDAVYGGMFQFTHPGRGATLSRARRSVPSPFQFTHPGRGATQHGILEWLTEEVSIHAPREGCDL
ncbi:hypothetical protein HMPREF1121_00237 [Porphyromonas sp. KLE 1280]|nr:hypothetical protein HMPREF1121_00237 [Porphyromonas sp. KLE 1280]